MEPTETLQELKAELVSESQAETVIPKKRGRPRKAQTAETAVTEQAPIDTISPEMVGEILSFGFEYIADRRGEHWKLSIPEKDRLAILSSRVANKYLPEWIARFGDEIALSTMLGLCIFARFRIDAEIAKAQVKPNGDTANISQIVSDIQSPPVE